MTVNEIMARGMAGPSWDAKDFNETSNGCDPEEEREYWRERARDNLTALKAAGFVIVPVEPTEAMVDAAWESALAELSLVSASRLAMLAKRDFKAPCRAAIQAAQGE
jgi:hypothetical protein